MRYMWFDVWILLVKIISLEVISVKNKKYNNFFIMWYNFLDLEDFEKFKFMFCFKNNVFCFWNWRFLKWNKWNLKNCFNFFGLKMGVCVIINLFCIDFWIIFRFFLYLVKLVNNFKLMLFFCRFFRNLYFFFVWLWRFFIFLR